MGLKGIVHNNWFTTCESDKIRPKWDWKIKEFKDEVEEIYKIKSDQNGIESYIV